MSSSTASVSPATPTQHPFQRKVDDVRPSKADINFVIMDYLISEGYPRAADRFAKEANMKLPVGEDSVFCRVDIRKAIHAGDIDTAINKINDLNPQILDTDPALHFALLRLQLIELIRSCTSSADANPMSAIVFASSQLAPRAATKPAFLKDLELTMSLLVMLPTERELPPQVADLLQPSLRRDVASRVNEAILSNMGQRSEARLRSLVRLRVWAEDKARASGKDLPPLPLVPDEESVIDAGARNSGDVDDIMVS